MSLIDEITESQVEICYAERQVLEAELAKRGVIIKQEELRERARQLLAGSDTGHPGLIVPERPDIETYDE